MSSALGERRSRPSRTRLPEAGAAQGENGAPPTRWTRAWILLAGHIE